MKVLLIRHGETEHNVAQLLAGSTDSRLTNHGVLQTQRLGSHLADRGDLRFTHIYASDLQRAYMTAQAVAHAQAAKYQTAELEVVRLRHLREQDFGSNELVEWSSKKGQDSFFDRRLENSDADFVPKETVEAMKTRARVFLDDFIVPLFATDEDEESTVAVASHGLFLGVLWRSLLARFAKGSVTLSPNAVGNQYGAGFSPLEHIGIWANTGYLEVEIHKRGMPNGMEELLGPEESAASTSSVSLKPNALPGRVMVIKTINGQEHLKTLKKTRGGLGNVTHDPKQKDIVGFFSRLTADREHENAIETGEVLVKALDNEIHVEATESPMGGVLKR